MVHKAKVAASASATAVIVILVLFALLLSVSAWAAGPSLSLITGTLVSSNGDLFTGTMRVAFLYAGATDTSCTPFPCILAPSTVSWPVYNGSIPTYARLSSNSNILPSGTYYSATLLDVFANPIETFNFAILSVASPFDIGSAQQTSITTQNLNLVSPASLTGNNTFSGSNTFSAAVAFSLAPTFNAGFTVPTGTPSFAAGFTLSGGTITLATAAAISTDSFKVSSGSGSTVKIDQHFDATGTGYKHVRTVGCTTSTAQFNTCSVTVTWSGTAFTNANYTPSCALEMTSGTAIYTITAKFGATMTVVITNLLSGTAANVALVDCNGSHD